MSTSHSQSQPTMTNSPTPGSRHSLEGRKSREFWSWDSSRKVLTRTSEDVTLKTSANPQITLEIGSERIETPATPVLQYIPAFSTPGQTFEASSSSNSIYNSTFSSFDDVPLTPNGVYEFDPSIGLGISSPELSSNGYFGRGRGIISIHSSTPIPKRTAPSTPPPSQTFLNEIFCTFVPQTQNSDFYELDTSQTSDSQPTDLSLDSFALARRKVSLTRDLSAPTASSSLKQVPVPRPRANTYPIWR
ncbi:hypothetical protein L218DRAFT_1081581 [Marasmius fiardii PR-910]|nr:hypothetical protein L218DRAFT_1081581 [Marasmius fiardii PR-910]